MVFNFPDDLVDKTSFTGGGTWVNPDEEVTLSLERRCSLRDVDLSGHSDLILPVITALSSFDCIEDREEARSRLKSIFDTARLARARCLYPVSEQDDQERLVMPAYIKTYQLLSEFLWIEAEFPDYEYVFDMYEAADQLRTILSPAGEEKEEPVEIHQFLPHLIRRCFSSLLAEGLMQRVNTQVGADKGFLNDGPLDEQLEGQIDWVLAPERWEERGDLNERELSEMLETRQLIGGVIDQIRDRVSRVCDDEESLDLVPTLTNPAVRNELIDVVARGLEFMGDLRPHILHLGRDNVRQGVRQIVSQDGVGSDVVLRKRLALEYERLIAFKQAFMELERQLETDPLTDLRNRARWVRELSRRREISERRKVPEPYTVISLDFSGFKRFNDSTYCEHPTEGYMQEHKLGDYVLIRLAQALQGCLLRDKDLFCRVGGEEFFVLLPEYLEKSAVLTIMQRMDDVLSELSEELQIKYRPEFEEEMRRLDPDYDRLGYVRIGFSAGVARSDKNGNAKEVAENSDHVSQRNKTYLVKGEKGEPKRELRHFNDRIGVVFGDGYMGELDEFGWEVGVSLTDLIDLEAMKAELVDDEKKIIVLRFEDLPGGRYYRIRNPRYNLCRRLWDGDIELLDKSEVEKELGRSLD